VLVLRACVAVAPKDANLLPNDDGVFGVVARLALARVAQHDTLGMSLVEGDARVDDGVLFEITRPADVLCVCSLYHTDVQNVTTRNVSWSTTHSQQVRGTQFVAHRLGMDAMEWTTPWTHKKGNLRVPRQPS
jgi:hypothetical protein